MNYDKIYQNEEFWKTVQDSGDIYAKIPIVRSWIPSGVGNILDIGCGNGIITNALADSYAITGVDFSAAALRFVKGKKIQASADKIPVGDASYDLVFSSEMLEHLTDGILEPALAEIRRIARNYVFITVPDSEFLENMLIKCYKCGATFHKYGHVQSIGLSRLNAMLGNEFRLIRSGCFGSSRKSYNPFLLKIRQRVANVWATPEKHSFCPVCGNTDFGKKRKNLLSRLCNELNQIVSRKRPYWLFALYERREV